MLEEHLAAFHKQQQEQMALFGKKLEEITSSLQLLVDKAKEREYYNGQEYDQEYAGHESDQENGLVYDQEYGQGYDQGYGQ